MAGVLILLLAAIAIPNFVKARATAQANACINNLRLIDGAAQQWALETKQGPTANVSENVLIPYIKLNATGRMPVCPGSGGNYIYSSLDNSNGVATCSLSTATPAHRMP